MAILQHKTEKFRKAEEDIGIDRVAQVGRQRIINNDGSFNIIRKHDRTSEHFQLFHYLLNVSWIKYWVLVTSFYLVINSFFAAIYLAIGVEHLNGIVPGSVFRNYLYCFFFSAQSFTTVGYGGINPSGLLSNMVATLEAFLGLMSFAIATGTMYGRFSLPAARLKYGANAIVNPLPTPMFQFIVANVMSSNLMETEATVNYSFVAMEDGKPKRKFLPLPLRISKITMFPTSWTVVHDIDQESPLFGKNKEDLLREDAEFLILLRGFDDSISQTIYNRHSYRAHEVLFDKKFKLPFFVNTNGQTVLDLTVLGEVEEVQAAV